MFEDSSDIKSFSVIFLIRFKYELMSADPLNIQIGTKQAPEGVYAVVQPNGPILLYGIVPIMQQFIVPDDRGISVHYQEGESYQGKNGVALCRCGLSQKKPFCDGSHKQAMSQGVDLTETATFKSELDSAEMVEGPDRFLTDDEKFCAFARFCDAGQRVWNEVQLKGESAQDLTLDMAHHCPGGRLIVWDNQTRTPIEVEEPPSANLIEDISLKCSGPIMLRGGIPVKSSKGQYYEVRNRQALCRCGQSSNKPFCDGTHASMKFQDDLPNAPKKEGKVW